jgi:hypothetical protein
MNKTFFSKVAVVFALFAGFHVVAQESCDDLNGLVKKYLEPKSGEAGVYISDGQEYRVFLDGDQKAEFHFTFYGGSVYRLAASAGSQHRSVIFEVWDTDEKPNLLFSNENFNNEPYWDFKVNNTVEVVVQVKLDLDKKESGCAVMLLGFKQ